VTAEKVVNKDLPIDRSLKKTLTEYLGRKKMNKQNLTDNINKINWNDIFEYDNGNLIWKDHRTRKGKVAGCNHDTGGPTEYRVITYNQIQYKAHRVIWQMFNGSISKDKVIDHINLNGLDNRIENLQLVSPKQNQQRRTGRRCYTIRNDSPNKYESWRWSEKENKMLYLGRYGTPCGAIMKSNTYFVR